MKNIYVNVHMGALKSEAFDKITRDWNITEKTDFSNWMKYYESGDQYKYKKAQNAAYYVNDSNSYFLPLANMKPSPTVAPSVNDAVDFKDVAQDAADEASKRKGKEDERRVIEDQRKKILGRLNSAEKLLSSHQGQLFAGSDFEKLLTAIFELKKQIQTINKISQASLQTIVDLIIRQSNILRNEGCAEGSAFMVKLAQQTPGDFNMPLGEVPASGSVPQGGGSLGNNMPNLDGPLPGIGNKQKENGSAVDEFIDNLNDSGVSETDKDDIDDINDIEMDDDIVLDQEIAPENELTVEAQAAPPPVKAPTPPAKPTGKDNIEVEAPGLTPDNVKKAPDVGVQKTDFDAIIDSAFANLSVNDVINKLEQVNNIFRTREIARQLAICDLMLSRLGLAQYFPQLGESINKALDSGQYALVRIDEILSKLRGAAKTPELDLEGTNQKTSPEAEAIKTNLQQSEQKEKQRKEVKKQLQDQTDLEKATKPEGSVENPQAELAAPTQIEAPAPRRPTPAAPPVG